jgi:ParB family transcriptional regulator, chromosome partitioning protein
MTMESRRTSGGLGRGLSALIPEAGAAGVAATPPPTEIPLREIRRNPDQPRHRMEQEELERLAASVAEHGILQPVLVRRVDGAYQLIAGERRVRAAAMAGLERVPAYVRETFDDDRLMLALVENLQRSDLNAVDEARAFRRLLDEFGLTQDLVASRVGRSRSSVANTLRLLETSAAVQDAVESSLISEGHARAIATLDDHARQDELLSVVTRRGLSVRQTEELARALRDGPGEVAARGAPEIDPDLERIQGRMRDALGTKVTVQPRRKGGRITIEYYDGDDLGRLVDRLTGAPL